MKYTILGEVIPKKNSRINTRSGRSFPNPKYTEWEHSAILQVKKQNREYSPINKYPIEIHIELYYGSARQKDIDNSVSSVTDMLVKSGILTDDNYKFINKIIVEFKGIDKNNPRVEIELIEPV